MAGTAGKQKWIVMQGVMRMFMMLLMAMLRMARGIEGPESSDLLIEIGHISQPYNCTLFLDNLEVQ
jgi:hypothetical protein